MYVCAFIQRSTQRNIVVRWISLCETQHTTDTTDCWATTTALEKERWKRIDCANSFDRQGIRLQNLRAPQTHRGHSQQWTPSSGPPAPKRQMTIKTSDLNLLPLHQVAQQYNRPMGLSIPLIPIPIPHPLSLQPLTQLHCKAFNGSYNQQPPHLRGFCG